MYFKCDRWAASLNLNMVQRHGVSLNDLSEYTLLLMAWVALSVFFNHHFTWQVLMLSSLNLKGSNKSNLKMKTHIT